MKRDLNKRLFSRYLKERNFMNSFKKILFTSLIFYISLSIFGKEREKIAFVNNSDLLRYGRIIGGYPENKQDFIEKSGVKYYFSLLSSKEIGSDSDKISKNKNKNKNKNIFTRDLFSDPEGSIQTRHVYLIFYTKKDINQYEILKIYSINICPFGGDNCEGMSNKGGGVDVDVNKNLDFIVLNINSTGIIGLSQKYRIERSYFLKFNNEHFETYKTQIRSTTEDVNTESEATNDNLPEDLSFDYDIQENFETHIGVSKSNYINTGDSNKSFHRVDYSIVNILNNNNTNSLTNIEFDKKQYSLSSFIDDQGLNLFINGNGNNYSPCLYVQEDNFKQKKIDIKFLPFLKYTSNRYLLKLADAKAELAKNNELNSKNIWLKLLSNNVFNLKFIESNEISAKNDDRDQVKIAFRMTLRDAPYPYFTTNNVTSKFLKK